MLSTKSIKSDIFSGLVVFLVALPLCLGIALGSGASPFAGIISGIIGGIVVGLISNSNVSVSGPAAGLIAILVTAIATLGSYETLLVAVIIAGIIQLLLGLLKAGSISNYIPTNVIEGMLAGIGISIFLKQIPHAIGFDKDFEGDESFFQFDGENTFTEILKAFDYVQIGAILVTLASLIILISWEKLGIQKKVKFLPGALIAVAAGILLNQLFITSESTFTIENEHLVNLPVFNSFSDFTNAFATPNFSEIFNYQVWVVAATIAIVASVESLLCIEAADRLDPQKRFTDTNLELKAQGIGNILAGFLGGLPMTSVVVRTSANVNAGAKTKLSAIIHGVLLLICVITIPVVLNKIPYATLAAILLLIGYKLAKPSIFKHFYHQGWSQFIPFVATIIGVVGLDLLKGVGIGLAINIFLILRGNLKRAYNFRKEEYTDGDVIHIDLAQEVSFLNKAAIKETLKALPPNSKVIINASDTEYIAHDVIDLIREFKTINAIESEIELTLVGFKEEYNLENSKFEKNHVFVEHEDIMNYRKTTITSSQEAINELTK